MKLALFGGTFDPVHRAHLAVAREAADRFGLDRVLLVPAAHPPHKQSGAHAPYEDRVRMVEIAACCDPRFEVSRLEEGTARSYSIDTIEKVRATLAVEDEFGLAPKDTLGLAPKDKLGLAPKDKLGLAPKDELYFIIGADAFAEVHTWRRWRDVAAAVRFLVVSRPNAIYAAPPEVKFDRLDTLSLDISSSEIRRALAHGERPESLDPNVLAYIQTHRLYV